MGSVEEPSEWSLDSQDFHPLSRRSEKGKKCSSGSKPTAYGAKRKTGWGTASEMRWKLELVSPMKRLIDFLFNLTQKYFHEIALFQESRTEPCPQRSAGHLQEEKAGYHIIIFFFNTHTSASGKK